VSWTWKAVVWSKVAFARWSSVAADGPE